VEKLCTISVLTNHSTGEKITDCCFQINTTIATIACPWCLNAFQKCKTSVKREVKKAEDQTKTLKGIRYMIRWMSVHKDVSRIANFSSPTVDKNW